MTSDAQAFPRHSLSRSAARAMRAASGAVCTLCGLGPADGVPLVVDHCHRTGDVRDLLCGPSPGRISCNILLGMIEARGAEWTISSLEYAKYHAGKSRGAEWTEPPTIEELIAGDEDW